MTDEVTNMLYVLKVLLIINIIGLPFNIWVLHLTRKLKNEATLLIGKSDGAFEKSLQLNDKAMDYVRKADELIERRK